MVKFSLSLSLTNHIWQVLGVNSVVTVVCKQLHPQRSGGSAAIAESHKVPCMSISNTQGFSVAQSWEQGHYSSSLDMYLKCGRNILLTPSPVHSSNFCDLAEIRFSQKKNFTDCSLVAPPKDVTPSTLYRSTN